MHPPRCFRFFPLLLLLLFHHTHAQCPLQLDSIPLIDTNGMILHLPFDSNLQNLGSGNYTITNNGGSFVQGICGEAMEFDGIDDFVEVSPAIEMHNDLTIVCWLKVYSGNGGMGIFFTRDQCLNSQRAWGTTSFTLGYHINRDVFYGVPQTTDCYSGSMGDRYDPGFNLPLHTWYLIAVSVNSNSSEARSVWMHQDCDDAAAVQFDNVATAYVFNGNYAFRTTIGAASAVPAFMNSLDGIIDEMRVYDRILSEEEMEDIFHTCRPVRFEAVSHPSCDGDSAWLYVVNPEEDVVYSLQDITNNQQIGAAIQGNCDTIAFFTGLVTDTTAFQILATHSISNCSLLLDTTFWLKPAMTTSYTFLPQQLCPGDSLWWGGQFHFADTILSDTFLTNQGCDSIVTLQLSFYAPPDFNLGSDTVLCFSSGHLLEADETYGIPIWQYGIGTNPIYVNQSGVYVCHLYTHQCNLVLHDSIEIAFGGYSAQLDTSLCWGDSLQIGEILILNSGMHQYLFTDQFGCDSLIDVSVSLKYPPDVYLGKDTTLCLEEKIFLDAGEHAWYLWSTGDLERGILVSDSGEYWVKVQNECGFTSDSILIAIRDCEPALFIPNVFTPNGDGLNEQFEVHGYNLRKFTMLVFNRWGEQLFESNDIQTWWDGTYKGRICPVGVYYYHVEYQEDRSLREYIRQGTVTLLR